MTKATARLEKELCQTFKIPLNYFNKSSIELEIKIIGILKIAQ